MTCKWKCWKCKLGFHDWEVIEEISHNELFAQVYELTHGKRPGWENTNEFRRYQKRVCLRCKQYEDGITLMKSYMLRDYEQRQIRKSKRDLVIQQITEDLKYRTRNETAPIIRFNFDNYWTMRCLECGSEELKLKNGSDIWVCQGCMQRHEPL